MREKLLPLFNLLLSIFILVSCGKKDDSKPLEGQNQSINERPKDAIYYVKSGIVTYEMDFIGKQTQTLYFDDYGKKEAKYFVSEVEMFGQKSRAESVEIKTDGYLYKYDLKTKEGTKTKFDPKLGMEQSFPKDFENLTQEIIEQFKIKELGKKEILGKECKGFEMTIHGLKSEVWTWNNIPLISKIQISKDSEPMEFKAVKIETDVIIPEEKFKVPSDIKLKEI